jgi:hypothetical protein
MHSHRRLQRHRHCLFVMLTLLATTLTTSEAYAAKSSSSKPKPKPKPAPQSPGNELSPLEKVEKIVSIGQNVFSAANAAWGSEDYAYYTASLELVKYKDLTVIVENKSQKRIDRTHWVEPKSGTEKYRTVTTRDNDGAVQEEITTETPFPHGWGHVNSIKLDHYYYPSVNKKSEITYSMPATQYKILLHLENAPSSKINLIDSARIIETLNYQEIQPNETYDNYRKISSSDFIDNRPVKTETFDTREARITMSSAQLISYPKVNAVTVFGDHTIHFLAPRKAHYIISPTPEDATENP